MSGVYLQAQMVSQILSAVQDDRLPIQVWSWWAEFLWIWAWSPVGVIFAWFPRSLLHWELAQSLVLGTLVAVGILYGVCFFVFWQHWWLPLLPPALTLGLTSILYLSMPVSHLNNQNRHPSSKL
jgi:CHASE2 domain-containing sensor protein